MARLQIPLLALAAHYGSLTLEFIETFWVTLFVFSTCIINLLSSLWDQIYLFQV